MLLCMKLIVCLVLCVSALVPSTARAALMPQSQFAAFRGAWTCTVRASAPPHKVRFISHWTFAPADAGGWMRLSYGSGGEIGGNAVVGYLAKEHTWIYEDFHTDGSYAHERGSIANGVWTWAGTYYPPHGAAPITGKVEWHTKSRAAFEMLFYPPGASSTSAPSGKQSCVRTQPY